MLDALKEIKAEDIETQVEAADGFHFWGNWCGPGHGGAHGGPDGPIDTCCMLHDQCYDRVRYFNCACNVQLVNCLKAVTTTNASQLVAKTTMIMCFSKAPCLCSNGLPCKPIPPFLSCNC